MKIVIVTESRYNNRQIERMLDEQADDIKDHITFHVDPLKKEVEKTNGTVRWLTKMMYMAIGALLILSPILGWIVNDYLKFKETYRQEIRSAVHSTLDTYQFEIVE